MLKVTTLISSSSIVLNEATFYLTGGAATICQRLQTQLGMDNVLTNQPVSSISEYNDRVYIETKVNATRWHHNFSRV